MPPVIVAASPNNFVFSVCDFGPVPPSAFTVDPAFAGNCVVACQGSDAVAGDFSGNQVQFFDITNPAAPVPRGSIATPLSGGIGAIAIRNRLVAAGERNGFRVVLIDFSNPASPSIVGTVNTSLGGFVSLAFRAARIVVGSGTNAPPVCVEANFTTSPPTAAAFSPGFLGGASLDADPASNRIAVGNRNGFEVVLLDAATKAVLATAVTALGGVTSVAISGTLVLAGSANDFDLVRINFGVSPAAITPFNPGYGSGSVVDLSGTTGCCGAIVGGGTTPVRLLNLAANPPTVTGSVNPGIASIGTVAMGPLAGAPPATPTIQVAPTALVFGAVRVGTASAPETLTIRNTGTAPLNVTNIQSSSPRYTFTPGPPLTIQPGLTATVDVRFQPTAVGPVSASLTITSNDPTTPTVTVTLSGTGAVPQISVSPTSLAFGSVPVCLSGTRQVTVSNTGGVTLTVSSIGTTGPPFAASPGSAVVAPGASRTVTVAFAPTALGAANGTLTISSDDPANPTITVGLTGSGAPTPPPAVSVTPSSLNFGAVPRQFFAGLRVTVANTGPCQSLSVTLDTSGVPFSVTSGSPTTNPGTTQFGPITIAPNSSTQFAVIFGPTAIGAAAGTLTISSNDPVNPSLTIPLTGTGVDVAPAALELVLDRSGSMSDPAPGGTKMDGLKRAVKMFADLVLPGQGDEMGAVEFDDVVTMLTGRGIFDAAKQTAIKTDVDTLFPRGLTSIGGGLQLGQGQVAGSAVPRKAMLVFTDGMENTPPMIAAVKPAIIAAGTEIYAVGLGQPQDIDAQKLSDLAASSNGRFFLTDDTLILRKNFVQVLADAFRQSMAADPVMIAKQGQVLESKVWITQCERRVSFVLNWDHPAAQLGFEVMAPDGTLFTPTSPASNQLVRYGQQPGYRFYQIALPPLDPPSGAAIAPARVGQWIMRVTGLQVGGAGQRCATSVFVDSDLRLEARADAANTRKPLRIVVTIRHGLALVSTATVAVRMSSPTKTISQIVGRPLLERSLAADAIDELTGFTVLERALRSLGKTRKVVIPTRKKQFKLKPREGKFILTIPAPLVEGVYQFEIEVIGQACGGTFQRYASFAVYVGSKASPSDTHVTVSAVGPGAAAVTVTPQAASGVPLGPGLGSTLGGMIAGGELVGLVDNLDGSYTVQVRWGPRTRKPTLRLLIGETRIEVPLSPTTDTKHA